MLYERDPGSYVRSPLSPSKFSHAPNDEVITLDYTQRIWNWQWRNHGFIQ
jgi:zona occludens toxin (predicted ATPase)